MTDDKDRIREAGKVAVVEYDGRAAIKFSAWRGEKKKRTLQEYFDHLCFDPADAVAIGEALAKMGRTHQALARAAEAAAEQWAGADELRQVDPEIRGLAAARVEPFPPTVFTFSTPHGGPGHFRLIGNPGQCQKPGCGE